MSPIWSTCAYLFVLVSAIALHNNLWRYFSSEFKDSISSGSTRLRSPHSDFTHCFMCLHDVGLLEMI